MMLAKVCTSLKNKDVIHTGDMLVLKVGNIGTLKS